MGIGDTITTPFEIADFFGFIRELWELFPWAIRLFIIGVFAIFVIFAFLKNTH